MGNVVISGLQQGLIYGFMTLGVLLTFYILDFPDLTVEGSFPLGAAITARAVVEGIDPLLAVLCGAIAGGMAGAATGLMNTRLKVNNILAGILTTSAIYTVMLRSMGRPNISLLGNINFYERVLSLFGLSEAGFSLFELQIATISILFLMVVGVRLLLGWFLNTDLGLTIRATGSNEKMMRSLGIDTKHTKLLTLILSNSLVGFSGALACQIQGFADVGMGIGVLVAAIASVILGEILSGKNNLKMLLTGVVLGSILYRALLALGLRLNLPAEDFKMVTAVLVLLALALPNIKIRKKSTIQKVLTQKLSSRKNVEASSFNNVCNCTEANEMEARK
ncbi:MAG: ABC transporter permease [Clostridia bacterium]|nr:ABC transporter permease [Clostridia bacterium]MDD4048420.1 ABC transporter permease [Clostridia bacterium]